jgi:uncharacterized membrane protein
MATGIRSGEQRGESGMGPVAGADSAASALPWRRSPRLRAAMTYLARRYPPLPPAPQGTLASICTALVAGLALAFVVFFTGYTWSHHDAFRTFAEDLGIMDQALWNTLHGAPLHQTICNSLTDSNCLGDVSRFAIHFEPLMLPLSLLYVVAPSPKTLFLFQAIVVAAGAFPAYWLAARRLQSSLVGLVFAALYLLYPALQAAVTFDFHAVTLSAAFLMFALYFMLARNDRGLVIACLLALSTKEEIPLAVLLIGLSVALLQGRGRLGLKLMALAVGWIVVEVVVMRIASPLGHSPTASRYAYLPPVLAHPFSLLRQHVFDPGGVLYLRSLLSPAAYLPLLSPLALLIAVPAIGLNLLSSNSAMRSGGFQYNAEIVPVLVFATIESVALVAAVGGWLAMRFGPSLTRAPALQAARGVLDRRIGVPPQLRRLRQLRRVPPSRVIVSLLLLLILVSTAHAQEQRGYLPISQGFDWGGPSPHTQLANDILRLIPPDASVSAQAALVPHLSQRHFIYQFPYMDTKADYVMLDVTSARYPYVGTPDAYVAEVKALLTSHRFHVVVAQDGYLLLARGSGPLPNPADPNGLPDGFYTFAQASTSGFTLRPLDARFGPALELVGFDLSPPPNGLAPVNSTASITTYWRVNEPLAGDLEPRLVLHRADGSTEIIASFLTTLLHPMNTWRPGTIMRVHVADALLSDSDRGTLTLGIEVGTPAREGFQLVPPTLVGPSGVDGATPYVPPGGDEVLFAALQVR